MQAMQEQRQPLYGRFEPDNAPAPIPPARGGADVATTGPGRVRPGVGSGGRGIPQYLTWWDQDADLAADLERLVAAPAAATCWSRASWIMATEGGSAKLTSQVLYAIAAGRTKFAEIQDAVRTDPSDARAAA